MAVLQDRCLGNHHRVLCSGQRRQTSRQRLTASLQIALLVQEIQKSDPHRLRLCEFSTSNLVGLGGHDRFFVPLVDPCQLHVHLLGVIVCHRTLEECLCCLLCSEGALQVQKRGPSIE